MKMNVENKLNKVVKILKEKGFVVYRKGGKEPGVFYAKEGDSRIALIESLEDLQDAFKQGHYVCIEVGKLPYNIDLNYLRNLQEMSATAVNDLMGLKECNREEAFNIIQEWAKEFTEEYENCDFDGSYYDEIDAFIEEKLRTI